MLQEVNKTGPTPSEAYGSGETTTRRRNTRRNTERREAEAAEKKAEIVARQQIKALETTHSQYEPAKDLSDNKVIDLTPAIQSELKKEEMETKAEDGSAIETEDTTVEAEVKVEENVGEGEGEIKEEARTEVTKVETETTDGAEATVEEKKEEKLPEASIQAAPKTDSKPEKDFTIFYQKELLELERLQKSHQEFNLAMSSQLKIIGGYQLNFSNDNARYRRQVNDFEKQPALRSEFAELRKSEQEKYRVLAEEYEQFQNLFNSQIKTLEGAKKNLIINKGIAVESIVGTSNSWTGNNFGSIYRLWEITRKKSMLYSDGPLEARRKELGIKEGEEISTSEVAQSSSESSESIRSQVAKLSEDIDMLKEEVTAYNVVLLKEKAEFAATDWPKFLYLFHKRQLDAYRKMTELSSKKDESLKEIELPTKKDERLKELDKVIETEKGNPTSSQYLNAQRERVEIATRWEKIKERCNEVERFLQARAAGFSLHERDLKSEEEITLPDLNETPLEALNLLRDITAKKETLSLGVVWEKFVPTPERKYTYFQGVQRVKDFEEDKNQFVAEVLPAYERFIDLAVATYKGCTTTLQRSMATIQGHWEILKKEREERATWKVDPASKV